MNKVTGVLIDVNSGEASVKTVSSLEDYYSILDCDTFDIASRCIGENVYDIFCDDVGLLKCNPVVSAFSHDRKPMLVGNLFVTKTNEEGETISLSFDEIAEVSDNLVKIRNANGHTYMALVCEY